MHAPKRHRTEVAEANIGLGTTMLEVVAPEPLPRCTGVIKSLYSDFIVRELHLHTGVPARLISTSVPPEAATKAPSQVAKEAASETIDIDKVRSGFAAAGVSTADIDALCQMCATVNDGGAIEPVSLGPVEDKAARSLVHQAVKQHLGIRFESTTSEGGKILVQVAAQHQRGAKKGDKRGGGGSSRQATGWHSTWPEGKPEFLHFTLYKENIDTMNALRQLAQKMNISQKRLSVAGTKDKRGVTVQRVSCRHLQAEKVAGLNQTSWGRNGFAMVGDFTYETYGLTLGKLKGNRFTIVIRDVDAAVTAPSHLSQYQALLSEYGFANYFGPQRFGTTSVLTSDVGRCILQRDYKAAIGLMMKSKAEVCFDFSPVVDAYEGLPVPQNCSKAFEVCPHFCHDERDILRVLSESPNNFEGALLTLPRNMLMLYCHAVQSLVWNYVVTQRLLACPHVVEGDLVLVEAQGLAALDCANDEGLDQDEAPQAGGAVATKADLVRTVTADEVAQRRFRISDVVLPVPGPDDAIQYPSHPSCSKEAYLAIAESLGALALVRDEHNLAKIFHFHGTYRNIAVRPIDFSIRVATYSDPQQLLVQTDAMQLAGQELTESSRAGQKEPHTAAESDAPVDLRHALIAEFSLPPGSYATSLLRELVDSREKNPAAAAA